MSRLHIETYQRGDGFLALAVREGDLLSEAGICGEASERRAAIGAIHSYFNRQERPAAVVVHEPHPVDEWAAENPREARCPVPGFVYTDQTSIKRALEDSINPPAPFNQKFLMAYVDQGGTRTVRTILPSKVEDRHRGVAGFPETYLVAYDVDKDEPRTFRVDRIERLEAI